MSGEDLYSGTESMRSGLELDADKVEAFFKNIKKTIIVSAM